MSWSLSKTQRFGVTRRAESSDYTTLPSTLNTRATGIGYGLRWKPRNLAGFDSPPPGTYNLPILTAKTGPRMVRHAELPKNKRYQTPGPGSYDPLEPLGQKAIKIAMKSRIVNAKREDSPSPGTYSPNFALTLNSEFKHIGFGYGDRIGLSKKNLDSPGPGSYNIVSKFDKLSHV